MDEKKIDPVGSIQAPSRFPGAPEGTVQELKIWLRQDGAVLVGGPVENRLLCYSMIECARDAIHEMAIEANKGGRIIPASSGMMHILDGGKKKDS